MGIKRAYTGCLTVWRYSGTLGAMWAFLAGFFGVRALRNGATPDSVKQRRWDAKVAERERRRASARSWGDQWAIGWFRWTVIGLGVVVLAAVTVSVLQ